MWQAAQLERSLLGQYNGCGLCESRAGRCETLDLEIYAKNLELNDQAQKYIHKKFERLKRHLKPIRDARLEVSQTAAQSQADRIVAQMTITTSSYTLRGEESGLNVFAAVDAVADVMDRQIQKYKAKAYRTAQAKKSAKSDSAKASGLTAVPEEVAEEANPTGGFGTVVRAKRFRMHPMTVDKAITEMELLSHDFFVFYNAETEQYSVVYRRRNGDYGLIEPELA